jgi:hypothetical protein
MVELHRVGGTVRAADDVPIAGAWVALPESGLWASTDRDGRFLLNRIQPGEHSGSCGKPAEASVTVVPGSLTDIVVGTSRGTAAQRLEKGEPSAFRRPPTALPDGVKAKSSCPFLAARRWCGRGLQGLPRESGAATTPSWNLEPIMLVGQAVLAEDGIQVTGRRGTLTGSWRWHNACSPMGATLIPMSRAGRWESRSVWPRTKVIRWARRDGLEVLDPAPTVHASYRHCPRRAQSELTRSGHRDTGWRRTCPNT